MALVDVIVQVPRAVSCLDLRNDDCASSGSLSEIEGDGYLKTSRSELDLNQGKDSGIECGSDASLPDEETSQKIIETVEYYFSDANIMKDQFLLKHVRRNKEGFVSLKLVSSFRKVRSLCRNWKVVGESIKKSDVLALNVDGTKVRRVAPLPEIIPTVTAELSKPSSKTVLVYGGQLTIESLSDMFSKCGEIALIRILKPNSSASAEVKRVIAKNPDILSKGCGIVEFEEFDAVKQALAMDTGKENELRVVQVGADSGSKPDGKVGDSSKQTSPKKKKKSRRSLHGSKSNLKDASAASAAVSNRDSDGQKRRSSSASLGSSGSTGYLSTSPVDNWFSRRHSSYNVPSGSPRSSDNPAKTSSFASLKNRGHYKGSKDRIAKSGSSGKLNEIANESNSGSNGAAADSSGGSLSPWRLRRQMMRGELNSSSPSSSAMMITTLATTVPLVRTPRGPDGSRGFQTRQTLPPTAE